MKPGTLKRWARVLRKAFPPPYPVRIYVRSFPKGQHEHAWSIDKGDRYVVLIREDINESIACEALNFEWGHILRGIECADEHDSVYWKTVGRIWKRWDEYTDHVNKRSKTGRSCKQ